MTDFTDLVAVVTGGSSGIGAATADLLTQRGAQVAVLDRDVTASGDRTALALSCDVRDSRAVERAITAVAEQLGGIDVLVNNAGIGAVGDVTANDDEEWHRVFDVNVIGIARVTRAALPHLRRSSRAAIVNTCSVVAGVGLPERAVYAASKGAVAALTLAMAADHVREGVRVNAVTPGTADTPWVGRLLQQADDRPRPPAPCARVSRRAGWSPRKRWPTPSPTSPARCRPPPPARCWPWTPVSRAFGWSERIPTPRGTESASRRRLSPR